MTSNGPLDNEKMPDDDQKELDDHPNFGLKSRYSYDPFDNDNYSSIEEEDEKEGPFYRKSIFIVTMTLILLIICIGILILRPFPLPEKTKVIPTPYYDQPSLQFPTGMKEWKFSIDRYDEYVYMCLMQQDEAWHRCYPVSSSDTSRG